jgi:hypothetical protein
MGAAYWHTGDEKYAKEFAGQFMDWYRNNPLDKDHAYAWRSIEAGIRGHSWMQVFQRFVDSPDDIEVGSRSVGFTVTKNNESKRINYSF